MPNEDTTLGVIPECADFESVLTLVISNFSCDDSSQRHARLTVHVPGGVQPVMVYRGTSNLEASREVVNIAAPLLGIDDDKLYEIATHMDTMPLGALRRLGGILHIHEALAFGEFDSTALFSFIRVIAAQAFSLRSHDGNVPTNSNDACVEGE